MGFSRRTTLKLLAAYAAVPVLDQMPLSATTSSHESTNPAPSRLPAYKQSHLPIEVRVRDLVGRMTVEEKARQLDVYNGAERPLNYRRGVIHPKRFIGFMLDQAKQVWGDAGVGAIHDLYSPAELSNTVQEWVVKNSCLGIPVMFIEEGLHGYPGGTIFPTPIGLAATFNPEIAKGTGAAIAAEARANGVDMILAPVLDVAREPRWGRVEEDFGEDPYLTGQLGLAYVQGAQGTH